jgi:hypothetical protein
MRREVNGSQPSRHVTTTGAPRDAFRRNLRLIYAIVCHIVFIYCSKHRAGRSPNLSEYLGVEKLIYISNKKVYQIKLAHLKYIEK